MASWTWLLCDAAWNGLAELSTATGRSILYTRNKYAEATGAISHEDDAAELLLTAHFEGGARIVCYRRGENDSAGVVRFAGYLAPFTEQAEEAATLQFVFRSPFGRLIGDGPNRGRFTAASVPFTATDAGVIAQSLLSTANAAGSTDLTAGTTEATVARDRTYQYANVGEAIVNLTNVAGGFDFSETFTETGAEFNVHASLGDDQPLALFQYGANTLSNVRSMGRTTQAPINVATVLGANDLSSTQTDEASRAAYGDWPIQISASDVTEQATLDAKAEALLRPAPVKTVTFVPEFGLPNCPRPFDDFAVGDTVRLYAERYALTEDVAVRVNGLRITIDDDGHEAAEVQDPTTPDEDAAIRASMAVEVVGG